MPVILFEQRDRHHDVVDVVENERFLRTILRLRFHECHRVIAPMAPGVQVVGGMVAIVEAVSVGLIDEKQLANSIRTKSKLDERRYREHAARCAPRQVRVRLEQSLVRQNIDTTVHLFVTAKEMESRYILKGPAVCRTVFIILTGTSIKVILDRKSESGSTSSMRACCPQLPTIMPMRI